MFLLRGISDDGTCFAICFEGCPGESGCADECGGVSTEAILDTTATATEIAGAFIAGK